MRQLSNLAAVLVITAGTAEAAPPWSEYGAAEPLQSSEQLVETSCDVSIELRGAIADVEVHQKLTNQGPAALAATTELELPPGAQLVGMALQRGRGKAESALPVNAQFTADKVSAVHVLGPDPAIVTALPASSTGRPRYRVVLQPIATNDEVTLSTRWTATAEISGGALRLLLPGRGDGATRCRGLVQVKPGAGATVERIRLASPGLAGARSEANAERRSIDEAELAARNTAVFELGAADATLSAVLAFSRAEPLLWTQTVPLGDGHSARATTILTPPQRSASARRALLVIDGSRSMELVGRHNVQRLVRAIGSALPQKAEIEAVIYDRTATRVLGAWKPASPDALTAIETAISKHTAANGSDTAGAFAFARTLIADQRGQTMVVVITDGVMSEADLAPDALITALGGAPSDLDLHAVALTPGHMDRPDERALRRPVNHFGGSYLETSTNQLDAAIASIDEWLRPAWQELAMTGAELAIPSELRAGSGVVVFDLVKRPGKLKLAAQRGTRITVAARTAPVAPLAQLVLAEPGESDEMVRARLREKHVAVDDQHALVVLATKGSVAASRRQMIAGGGPFTRMVELDDPVFAPVIRFGAPLALGGSAIDRSTITLLMRQYLQPAAFTCYQRALGLNGALAGTAQFRLEIGRGELMRAQVTGFGDAALDACLLDAAYQVTPPLPNPDYNADDRTIVNYPLTFSVREQRPFIVAGDADSSSPLDIDAIKGGVPASARKRGPVKAGDTSTPLGGLRPTPSP